MRKYIFIFFTLTLVLHAQMISIGISKTLIQNKVSEKDLTITMNTFIKELLYDASYETSATYYDDHLKMAEDFKKGIINLVIAEPLIFVRYFDPSLLISGPTGYANNKEDANTLLIVGHKSGKKNLTEALMQAKSIVMHRNLSMELFLKVQLLEHNLSPKLLETKNAQESLLKLFFQKADIALIDKSSFDIAVELNPQIANQLVVLKSIPFTLGAVTFLSDKLPQEMIDKIITASFKINQTERGKQLLTLFMYSIIDVSKVSDLDPLYALEKRFNALAKNKKE